MTAPSHHVAELVSPLLTTLGFELIDISARRCTGRIPVEGNTQPFGLWHGGLSGVLAETLASLAGTVHAGFPERVALGTELNVSHHRPVAFGWVTGTATAVHLGRSSASYEVVLTDDEGRRVASARVSVALRPVTSSSPSGNAAPTLPR